MVTVGSGGDGQPGSRTVPSTWRVPARAAVLHGALASVPSLSPPPARSARWLLPDVYRGAWPSSRSAGGASCHVVRGPHVGDPQAACESPGRLPACGQRERARQQPGSRWGGAQALAPLDGSQALAHTVTAETARSSTRVGCFKKEEKGKGLAPALRTPRPRTPAPFRSRRCVSGLPCTAGRPLGTVLGAGPRAFPSLPS